MSNDLRDAVWQNGPTDPTMRFVLMSLCDRADKNGYCWPSHDDTSRRTGFTKKTVRTATKKLEADGWIRTEVRYASGRERSSNGIYINADMLLGVVTATTPSAAEVGNELPQVGYVLPPGVVTVTPESFIESVNEKEEEAPAPAIEPAAALREHFVKRTAIQPNDRTGVYDRDWQQPLGQLLALAGGDVASAVALLDRALAVARGDNERRKTYTVSCPRSLLGIASNLAATQQTAAAVADDDTIWQRALAAVTRRDFTDERLKAAIRAIGGTGRIASANGHDTETLKRSLGHAYRNVAAA
jgi:hypothetical protein